MNYTYKSNDSDTGRIVFETLYDKNAEPVIAILNLNCENFMAPGLTMGAADGMPCALLVTHARRRDIIIIKEKLPGRLGYTRKFFRVDDDFKPQILNLPNRQPTARERVSLANGTSPVIPDPALLDKSLRGFMADSHPEWLAHIVTRQIDQWRAENSDALIRFAPSLLTPFEIVQCVMMHPALALAYLKPRLSEAQLDYCVNACPAEAIQYAFERLTASKIADSVLKYPRVILEHAARNVSHDALRLCAEAAPSMAFSVRGKQDEEGQSIILSRSYTCCWQAKFGIADPAMTDELLDSVKRYPHEWLLTHENSCAFIFDRLEAYHKLVVEPKYRLSLLAVMPLDQHEFLLQSLASNI